MDIYDKFVKDEYQLDHLRACKEKDVDKLCEDLDIGIRYKLRLIDGLDKLRKEGARRGGKKKGKGNTVFAAEKEDKEALRDCGGLIERIKSLLAKIPPHLRGECDPPFFLLACVCVGTFFFLLLGS